MSDPPFLTPATSPQTQGKQFENYVALMYEGLGFRVTTNVTLGGQQIDILAEKLISGAGPIKLIVECKHRSEGTVSNQQVYDFITMLDAIKARHQITKGIIVTNGNFSKEAFAASEQNGMVELLRASTIENTLFDLSEVYREVVKEYEGTEIFWSYVPLHASIRYFEQKGLKKVENQRVAQDAEYELIKYICSSDIGFISVLADYGSGKTTLLQRLKYHFAKEYVEAKSSIKPIFIPLKNYHKMSSLDDLVQDCVRREFRKEVPLSLFWQAADQGEFLLLLDGFDELAPQTDINRRRENLMALSPLFTLKSKAILSCRPSYFVTEAEYEDAIRLVNDANLPRQPGVGSSQRKDSYLRKVEYDVLQALLFSKFVDYKPLRSIDSSPTAIFDLESFDEKQVDTFLMKFNDKYCEVCGRDWKAIKSFLMKIYDLSDLMRRPILLNMINVTILESGERIFSNAQNLGPSSLYDIYTRTQLALDWHKGEARQLLTINKRRDFAVSIALAMFDGKKLEVSYDEILAVVNKYDRTLAALRRKFETISTEEIATDIQICTFLSRDKEGFFKFSHKSFMEYFVALHLKTELKLNRVDKRFEMFLPREILYFLGGFAFVESRVRRLLIDWLKNKKSLAAPEVFRRNLAGALLYSGPEQRNLRLENIALSDIDIQKTSMLRAEFKSISFRRVKQEKISSEHSVYQNIEYTESQVNDWSLSNCEVSMNLVDTNAHLVVAMQSKFIVNGRRAKIENSQFEQCDVELAGGISFGQTFFAGGTLALPKGDSMLEFNRCSFKDLRIGASFELARGSMPVSECKFENCLLFGLQLSGVNVESMPFKECRGVVLIGEPLSKFRDELDARGMLMHQGLLLVSANAWSNQVDRETLVSEIEKALEDSFANELAALRETFNIQRVK